MAFIIIICISILGILGDYYLKLAGNNAKFMDIQYFLIGMIIYTSTAFGWFYAMKYIELKYIGAMYSIAMILLLTALGIFYFKETLTIKDIIGISFAIISIIILS